MQMTKAPEGVHKSRVKNARQRGFRIGLVWGVSKFQKDFGLHARIDLWAADIIGVVPKTIRSWQEKYDLEFDDVIDQLEERKCNIIPLAEQHKGLVEQAIKDVERDLKAQDKDLLLFKTAYPRYKELATGRGQTPRCMSTYYMMIKDIGFRRITASAINYATN